jgi:hypothetical protein
MRATALRVELLYFDGCPNHLVAEEVLKEVMADENVQAPVIRVQVETPESAVSQRFLGSPTIRLNGKDIDPAGDDGQYSLRCRMYRINGKLSGVPDIELIRAALRQALTNVKRTS